MSTYIKSFSNASDMRTYLDTAPGEKYYLFKNEAGVAGIGNIPESGKSIVSLFKGRDYLTFTAQQTNSKIKFQSSRSNSTAEYSLDNGLTWIEGTGVTVTLANVGDSIKYRGVISGIPSLTTAFQFASGKFSVSGSIMSMVNKNPNDKVIPYERSFAYYFNGVNAITTAPELSATTLTPNCYADMFENCTRLTTAPELPATTLANGCYNNMFNGCTSLIAGPSILPSETLVEYCYGSMFNGCTSLIAGPELMATANNPTYCIANMFSGCTSLNYVKIHTTSWNTSGATDWLNNVASTGTVECPTASTIPSNNASGIPTGWTRVNF